FAAESLQRLAMRAIADEDDGELAPGRPDRGNSPQQILQSLFTVETTARQHDVLPIETVLRSQPRRGVRRRHPVPVEFQPVRDDPYFVRGHALAVDQERVDLL